MRRETGFTYLGALFLIVLMGAALAGTGMLWSTASQRAKEKELLWVGSQYAQALRRYYQTPVEPRQYPLRLEDLLEDARLPDIRRHLRRLYSDPFTKSNDWGLMHDIQGRIVGVYSRFEGAPMKRAGFPPEWRAFEGRERYSEWQFVAEEAFMDSPQAAPQVLAPVPAGDGTQ